MGDQRDPLRRSETNNDLMYGVPKECPVCGGTLDNREHAPMCMANGGKAEAPRSVNRMDRVPAI
ncbi:MAG: hypothetical protein ACI8TQ_003388 [Planctomycetota bacterium]|jgi:hypothetical protein